jgi:hypothetical protein
VAASALRKEQAGRGYRPSVCEKRLSQALRSQHIASLIVWRILQKRLRVKEYRLQLLQALNSQDHKFRIHFCVDFQQLLEEDGFA